VLNKLAPLPDVKERYVAYTETCGSDSGPCSIEMGSVRFGRPEAAINSFACGL